MGLVLAWKNGSWGATDLFLSFFLYSVITAHCGEPNPPGKPIGETRVFGGPVFFLFLPPPPPHQVFW